MPISNQREVQIVGKRPNSNEWEVVDTQMYRNIPLEEIFPDTKIIIVDWMYDQKKGRPVDDRDSKGSGDEPPQFIGQDINIDGVTYHGNLAWGSLIKDGSTFGLEEDIGKCLFRFVEDGQRFGRWMMAQGWFGLSEIRKFKIKVIPAGVTYMGLPVDDGFGYITKEVAERTYSGRSKIKLDHAKGSYTFWQRIKMSKKLLKELMPDIQKRVTAIEDNESLILDTTTNLEDRAAYFKIDKAMIYHPYVANLLARTLKDWYIRAATSIDVGQKIKVACPTFVADFVLPNPGKHIVTRYPVDSYGSIQAIDIDETDEVIAERARIAGMEAVQCTIASKDLAIKNMLGIVDDLGGYDIVVCEDDIKMMNYRYLPEEVEAILSLTQWYEAGSLAGVNVQTMKDVMGFDVDGDMMEIIDCSERPLLFKAVKDQPNGETPKLAKTHSPIAKSDTRGSMICKSMSNIVGFASNLASKTFTQEDRAFMAYALGYKTVDALDRRLNFFIKVGTDGYKTDIDVIGVTKEIAQVDSSLNNTFKHSAPYTRWTRSDVAFVNKVPPVFDSMYGDSETGKFVYYNEGEIVEIEEGDLSIAIHPYMDGTIPTIAKMMLPVISKRISEPIVVRPLTEFRGWAPEPTQAYWKQAISLHIWFGNRSKTVNWKDGRAIAEFKETYRLSVDIYLKGKDRNQAAYTLWHVAHSAKSTNAGAASVFMAFPDECREIVKDKPGRKSRIVILTGITYQIPDFTDYTGEVDVRDVQIRKGDKVCIRKAVCAEISGQLEPKDDQYPSNMIGLVSTQSDQIDCGKYIAAITPKSKSSWFMTV